MTDSLPSVDKFIASATLSGVDTLKYLSFHGICFLDKIFSFSNLVSDFFSKWTFSKIVFQYYYQGADLFTFIYKITL